MNNNEVKNVENKQNNSLMRKTKAQLVEIILRKDSIEKNLRDDIANTKVELNKAKTKINTMQCDYSKLDSDYAKLKSDYFKLDSDYSSLGNDYSELKNDYIDICDKKPLVESELKNIIYKQCGFIWFLAIMFIISVAVNIALHLM